MSKIFAIIPARSGSKRIPGKNIRVLEGKPLIAYPIIAAIESGLFETVIVSTDSLEIAEIAEKYGGTVPFLRDPGLSDDFTPTIPVIRDAISKFGAIGDNDKVFCVYPTSIFVTTEILKNASLASEVLSSDNFLVSFTSFPYPIQRALSRDSNGVLNFISPENAQVRSQDLDTAFHDAAQFYIGRKSAWLTNDSVFSNALGFELPRKLVQDIDTPEDLEYATILMRVLQQDERRF